MVPEKPAAHPPAEGARCAAEAAKRRGYCTVSRGKTTCASQKSTTGMLWLNTSASSARCAAFSGSILSAESMPAAAVSPSFGPGAEAANHRR